MIFVNGGSRKQRDVAYDVASFCYNELIPRIRKCEIEINIKKMKKIAYKVFTDTM